jgi:hypothetical protein
LFYEHQRSHTLKYCKTSHKAGETCNSFIFLFLHLVISCFRFKFNSLFNLIQFLVNTYQINIIFLCSTTYIYASAGLLLNTLHYHPASKSFISIMLSEIEFSSILTVLDLKREYNCLSLLNNNLEFSSFIMINYLITNVMSRIALDSLTLTEMKKTH